MGESAARAPRLRVLLWVMAIGASAALVLLLTPFGTRWLPDQDDNRFFRSMSRSARLPDLADGEVRLVDPDGRFALNVPRSFRLDRTAPDAWRLRRTDQRGTNFILVEVLPGSTDRPLEELDAERDAQIERESSLPFTKLQSTQGRLDGRPAMNRSYLLGHMEAWEVLVTSRRDTVALTCLVDAGRLGFTKAEFKRVLETFRFPDAPPE